MNLSPQQVRAVLEVSEQTLRYWKRSYPALAGKRGYGPCYTFADVLLLLITKHLVDGLGIEVGKLNAISEGLLEACRSSVHLLSGATHVIRIDLERMVVMSPGTDTGPLGKIVIEIALHELAHDLQRRVVVGFGGGEVAQRALPLGPGSLAASKKQGRG
jgi:DNA-binding transcriptional MerR regulator